MLPFASSKLPNISFVINLTLELLFIYIFHHISIYSPNFSSIHLCSAWSADADIIDLVWVQILQEKAAKRQQEKGQRTGKIFLVLKLLYNKLYMFIRLIVKWLSNNWLQISYDCLPQIFQPLKVHIRLTKPCERLEIFFIVLYFFHVNGSKDL